MNKILELAEKEGLLIAGVEANLNSLGELSLEVLYHKPVGAVNPSTREDLKSYLKSYDNLELILIESEYEEPITVRYINKELPEKVADVIRVRFVNKI